MLLLDFFFQTGHQLLNNLRFLAKWFRDIPSDKFFMCAKFWFIDIIYAEVIANNSFSTGKPLSPRP